MQQAQVNKLPLRNLGIQHAMACSFITSAEYQTNWREFIWDEQMRFQI
jgi:hypothetical protein